MRLYLIFSLIVLLPANAMAQNALSYTTLGARSTGNEPRVMGHAATKHDMTPPAEAEAATTAAPKSEDEPIKRIWRQYKAMNKPGTEVKNEAALKQVKAPKKPKVPAAPKRIKADALPAQTEPTPKTGFAAILDQYHKSKDERRGMRAITVTRPEPPRTIKPEKTEPSSGEAQ